MAKNTKFILVLAFSSLFFISAILLSNIPEPFDESKYQNLTSSCMPQDLSGLIDVSETMAKFDGEEVVIPRLAFTTNTPPVLGLATEERWIEIDLSEQKLYAWEGNRLFLETLVSTGKTWTPTPTGEFRIWIKLRATKMEGGEGAGYYYLPNVPYVMYFENEKVPGWIGYGLHGTYWHSNFGNQMSHGCVNLSTKVAEQVYYWASPNLPSGKSSIKSTDGNLGTRIVIHE